MRISPKTAGIIHDAARKYFKTQARLFGSRTDDSKRGGDIDIYIETDLSEEIIAQKRTEMLAYLYLRLGVQKIDIVINNGNTALEIFSEGKKGILL